MIHSIDKSCPAVAFAVFLSMASLSVAQAASEARLDPKVLAKPGFSLNYLGQFHSGPSLNESVLYAFHGVPDGSSPNDLLGGPNGVFYGTTLFGGTGSCGRHPGCGTVYTCPPLPAGGRNR